MLVLAIAASLAAASSADFCVIAAEERGTGVVILTPRGMLQARVPVGSMPHEVEVAPDGRTAYVSQFGVTDYDSRIGTPGDHISEIDLTSARETARFVLPKDLRAPHGVKIRPGTTELFVNAESGGDTMLVYDTKSRRLLRSFRIGRGSHNFIFSRDAASLYVFAGSEGLAKYEAATGKLLASRTWATPIRGLRLAADGSILASAKGEVAVFAPGDLALERVLTAPAAGQLFYLEALSNGTIVAPSVTANGVVWFAPDRTATLIPTGKAALTARLAPDGLLYASNVNDDHLTVMSTKGRVLRQIGRDIAGPNGLGFGRCPRAVPKVERG